MRLTILAVIMVIAVNPAVAWEPQPKQMLALSCPSDELFYGGAKGGGKSDFLLADFAADVGVGHGLHWGGILFRKSYKELEELIKRSRQIYPKLGGKFSESKLEWRFPSGETLKMRHLAREADVDDYQGHQYTWVGFDELTNYATDYCYSVMITCARSAHGVPVRIRASGNPGGVGHLWVKGRFIDPMAPFAIYTDSESGLTRCFIKSLLDDNRILSENDPGYESRLAILKTSNPALYQALRFGDWDVVAGAAFQEIRRGTHGPTYEEFGRMYPEWRYWPVGRSMDWGYAAPFSVGWYRFGPGGLMVRYREWYGCETGQVNKGISKPASEVSARIHEIEQADNVDVRLAIADASIWDKPGNQNERSERLPSIAETMALQGVHFDRQTSIDAKKSRINSKQQIHERLKVNIDTNRPKLFVLSDKCPQWWRTMPVIPLDKHFLEDVDTEAEDHIYDETRYMCAARPLEYVAKVRLPIYSFEKIYQDNKHGRR